MRFKNLSSHRLPGERNEIETRVALLLLIINRLEIDNRSRTNSVALHLADAIYSIIYLFLTGEQKRKTTAQFNVILLKERVAFYRDLVIFHHGRDSNVFLQCVYDYLFIFSNHRKSLLADSDDCTVVKHGTRNTRR